eukprot:CAMPEP_0197247540 /NCGR_PEP_ID=MMETSP1429-20130617/29257_1 /TAXON_ID=49237 /ORGANISM="Chaetoceros  sp., Strain UNC1202" /LENGTH=43 /DNA_ID= /DNA_START= /DNA_END= /DNA_ORIENTATION=
MIAKGTPSNTPPPSPSSPLPLISASNSIALSSNRSTLLASIKN